MSDVKVIIIDESERTGGKLWSVNQYYAGSADRKYTDAAASYHNLTQFKESESLRFALREHKTRTESEN